MGLNLKALREANAELEKRSKGGLVLQMKDLDEATVCRLMQPGDDPVLNEQYYVEVQGYWVDKHFLLDPKVFGDDSIFEEYLANLDTKDKDIKALLHSDAFSQKAYFYFPMWLMDIPDSVTTFEDGLDPDWFKKYHLMQATITLIRDINKIVLSKPYQTTPNSILNYEQGANLVLSKTGTGKQTRYGATVYPDRSAVPDIILDKTPDFMNKFKSLFYKDEYIVAVLDNYFFGDPIKVDKEKRYDIQDEDSEPVAEEKKRPAVSSRTTITTTTEKKEAPKSGRGASKKTAAVEAEEVAEPESNARKTGSILDRLRSK